MERIVRDKIIGLKTKSDIEELRCDLYSILTTVLFSKEDFKSNKDIKNFLDKLGITLKDYVMKSRTQIIAKVLRIVQKADEEQIKKFTTQINIFFVNDKKEKITQISSKTQVNNNKSSKKNKDKNNYMTEILKKYSRN